MEVLCLELFCPAFGEGLHCLSGSAFPTASGRNCHRLYMGLHCAFGGRPAFVEHQRGHQNGSTSAQLRPRSLPSVLSPLPPMELHCQGVLAETVAVTAAPAHGNSEKRNARGVSVPRAKTPHKRTQDGGQKKSTARFCTILGLAPRILTRIPLYSSQIPRPALEHGAVEGLGHGYVCSGLRGICRPWNPIKHAPRPLPREALQSSASPERMSARTCLLLFSTRSSRDLHIKVATRLQLAGSSPIPQTQFLSASGVESNGEPRRHGASSEAGLRYLPSGTVSFQRRQRDDSKHCGRRTQLLPEPAPATWRSRPSARQSHSFGPDSRMPSKALFASSSSTSLSPCTTQRSNIVQAASSSECAVAATEGSQAAHARRHAPALGVGAGGVVLLLSLSTWKEKQGCLPHVKGCVPLETRDVVSTSVHGTPTNDPQGGKSTQSTLGNILQNSWRGSSECTGSSTSASVFGSPTERKFR